MTVDDRLKRWQIYFEMGCVLPPGKLAISSLLGILQTSRVSIVQSKPQQLKAIKLSAVSAVLPKVTMLRIFYVAELFLN
jgi:hypothetical protein